MTEAARPEAKGSDVLAIRTQLGWTQTQMAQYLGMTKPSIWVFENNYRNVPVPKGRLMHMALDYIKRNELPQQESSHDD